MKYFIIAGEASGDLHASHLMRELKLIDSNAEFCFLGGDLMALQGGKMITHYREMAFMGFIAVLKNARKVLANLSGCKKAIQQFKPDVVILIDYPSFNLKIAHYIKRSSNIPVYYYISPKIWAWKEFRIKQIKRYIDKMFTIFPFETEFYAKHEYNVQYIGNPTVETISNRPNKNQQFEDFCKQNGLSGKPIIAVLSGSRKQEIEKCLPRILDAVKSFDSYQIVIAGAPGIPANYYQHFISSQDTKVVFSQTYELLYQAKAAIVNSGTATLETALIGTPQVVVYHVPLGRFALFMKKLFIKVKYVSLVNILGGREIVRELLGYYFTPENLKKELHQLLSNNNYREAMLNGYHEIETQLGDYEAAKNGAKAIVQCLQKSNITQTCFYQETQ